MRISIGIFILLAFSSDGFCQKYLLEQDVNSDTLIPKFGYKRKYDMANYMGYATMCGPTINHPPSSINYLKSCQFRVGFWGRVKLNKQFALGSYLEYARDAFRLTTPIITDTSDHLKTLWTKQINNNLVLGLFNRLNLNHGKLYIDFGAYYAFDCSPTIITKIESKSKAYSTKKTIYTNPALMQRHHYGLDFKVNYKMMGIYSRYRLSGLYSDKNYDLPKLTIGLVIDYKD